MFKMIDKICNAANHPLPFSSAREEIVNRLQVVCHAVMPSQHTTGIQRCPASLCALSAFVVKTALKTSAALAKALRLSRPDSSLALSERIALRS
ncbi:MAG: hypothetical protein Q4A28_09240 [Brachymonas sp.]|nr:hypothetical protein [Brachymonas sp.]